MPERAEDFDYLCMRDGRIYRGPDTGDIVPLPPIREMEYRGQKYRARGWPTRWKGHPVSHAYCDEHAQEGFTPMDEEL